MLNPEQWQKANSLFHAAIERSEDDRRLFLQRACAGDGELLKEIERLVAIHFQADKFMQTSDFTGKSPGDSAGKILQNRYRIIRPLGQGGMGTVYLAIDERLGYEVALKQMFHSRQEVLAEAFEREARILARLHHRCLPKVSDHFSEDDSRYLVMQYIAGEDLGEALQKSQGALPVEKVLNWADSLLDALEYLHSHEPPILHRDIKPQNLKISDKGELFLLDFGLAKDTATSLSVSHVPSVIGYSINYSPLEQISRERTTAETDIYAFCATFYHLLTNTFPADALSRLTAKADELPDPLIPANKLNPLVSAELASVLQRGMEQRREKRLSAAQLRRLLRDPQLNSFNDIPNIPTGNNDLITLALPAISSASPAAGWEMRDSLKPTEFSGTAAGSLPQISPPAAALAQKTTSPAPGAAGTVKAGTMPGQKFLYIGLAAIFFLILGTGFTVIAYNQLFHPTRPTSTPSPETSAVPPVQDTSIVTPATDVSPALQQIANNQDTKKPGNKSAAQTSTPKIKTPASQTSTPKTGKSPKVFPTIIPQ